MRKPLFLQKVMEVRSLRAVEPKGRGGVSRYLVTKLTGL